MIQLFYPKKQQNSHEPYLCKNMRTLQMLIQFQGKASFVQQKTCFQTHQPLESLRKDFKQTRGFYNNREKVFRQQTNLPDLIFIPCCYLECNYGYSWWVEICVLSLLFWFQKIHTHICNTQYYFLDAISLNPICSTSISVHFALHCFISRPVSAGHAPYLASNNPGNIYIVRSFQFMSIWVWALHINCKCASV